MDGELKGEIRLVWKTWGFVKIDAGGKLELPTFRLEGGVYRFSIQKSDGSRVEYIGETDNLNRRFSHYRNPGPTQQTNRRVNFLCKKLIEEGARIEIDVIEEAWIRQNGVEAAANFYDKNDRRLFEHFSLAVGWSKDIERLNK